MKKCYSCGADVPDESKFCPKCGKPIKVTQDLIDRAKANDSEAQTELYERTYKTVYSRIRAKVPDNDTAMDIMQEVYLNAFTNLDQLQTPESFPSWLLTIASRQVCAWYRKNGKENENVQMSQLEYENDDTISDEDDLLAQPEYREDFSPDESLDRAETGRLLSEILDTLPEDQRIILTMRYYDEMSLQEISDELGVNLSTVKTRLTAGKKKVEAKVLELEKSGTKLYSLGPVAFLVFLLHHAELFVPAIPANTVIGLTAAGAGAGGAAATAAHVTAGAAAKAAVVTAAKGVSVKVIAIIAAAVVVVGGGVTAGVLIANNQDQETAEVSETLVIEPVEPSEAPTPTPPPEPIPDPPSYEAVYNMTAPLGEWAANITLDTPDTANSSVGKLSLNTNEAVELAGLAAASEGNYMTGDLSSDQMNTYLKRLFGSQFQLSDFANTPDESGSYEYSSAFSAEYPHYSSFLWLYQAEDGNFKYEAYVGDPFFPSVSSTVKSVEQNEDGTCMATVEYDLDSSSPSEGYYHTWSFDIHFDLVPDEEAEYGWAITSLSFGDDYDDVYETVPTEDIAHAMLDPLGYWSVNAMGDAAIAAGPITPTLNQAAELAAAACFMTNREELLYTEPDLNAPIVWSYIIPESEIKESLRNRFGPEYNLSDFTNTVQNGNFVSAFETVCETGNYFDLMLFTIDGHYDYSELATEGMNSPSEAVIKSIERSDTGNDYIVDVEYMYSYHLTAGGEDYGYTNEDGNRMWANEIHDVGREVEYKLTPNDGSDYGWVISQITYKDFNEYDVHYETGEY